MPSLFTLSHLICQLYTRQKSVLYAHAYFIICGICLAAAKLDGFPIATLIWAYSGVKSFQEKNSVFNKQQLIKFINRCDEMIRYDEKEKG